MSPSGPAKETQTPNASSSRHRPLQRIQIPPGAPGKRSDQLAGPRLLVVR